MIPYSQSLHLCFGKTGTESYHSSNQLPNWRKTVDAVEVLRKAFSTKALPLLHVPARMDDLAAIKTMAAELQKDTTDVVMLGTGGSSLGGQALCQIANWNVPGLGSLRDGPRLHFMDNLDPYTFAELLEKLDLPRTKFVVISKSGGTAETLMQAMATFEALEKAGLSDKISQHVFGITEPDGWKTNPLRHFLAQYHIQMLEHDTGIGGRYSALTNVGLLPAAIVGLDIDKIRAGAKTVIDQLLNAKIEDIPAAVSSALFMQIAAQKNETILMAYTDKLERFTAWYVQLWAESLGKNGFGTTPIRALGPVDQHSQLQLFLDGPQNKVFTILTTDTKGAGPKMAEPFAQKAKAEEFIGKTIGDLVAAQGQATAETLAKRGHPVRQIHVPQVNEAAIGALMMHFFLETIISAFLLGIDPYDQPAVEEGKVLAKAYLRQG